MRIRTVLNVAAIVAVGLLPGAARVQAHHAFSAEFDAEHLVHVDSSSGALSGISSGGLTPDSHSRILLDASSQLDSSRDCRIHRPCREPCTQIGHRHRA